jgi:hypothetical protein
MNQMLGREMAAARMGDIQRQMQHTAMVKQARGEKRRSAKQAPSSQGRFVPAGALRLGRAVLRLRSKPAQTAASC